MILYKAIYKHTVYKLLSLWLVTFGYANPERCKAREKVAESSQSSRANSRTDRRYGKSKRSLYWLPRNWFAKTISQNLEEAGKNNGGEGKRPYSVLIT